MNPNIEMWDRNIGALYEAVLQPKRLRQALVNGNTMLESDFSHLVGFDSSGQETLSLVTAAVHESTVAQYRDYYAIVDPRLKFIQSVEPGHTYRCSTVCDPGYVNRNQFYQDFMIPNGLRYIAGACLYKGDKQSVYIAFNHILGREDFSDENVHFLGMYIGHLKRAVETMIATAPISGALALGESSLQVLQYGVVGVDAAGRFTFANRYAESAVLPELHGQLDRRGPAEGSALQRLCGAVQATARSQAIVLATQGGAPWYVSAIPLPPPDEASADAIFMTAGGKSSTIALIFSRGKNRAMVAPSVLMQLFCLTPSEARLAYELGTGSSIEGYAAKFHVSVATARTQLRAVLHKTGEVRQQDLVRMLTALPAVADRA